ncbi:hypothetical protein C7M84_020331 [Penaeus vannamei]|uniref:Uncharacterized protein n=1 Tax=Penaeus vannamei TaxID=6689 RepID=A0A423SCC5_PENVA|nr:hypothetical protein C7M84_020331 [Penaeus vannamei]
MPMTDGGMRQVSCAKRSFIPNPLPPLLPPPPFPFSTALPPSYLCYPPPLPSFAPAALLPPFITASLRPLLYSYFPLFLSPMSISPTLLYSLLFSLSVFLLLFHALFPHPFCGPSPIPSPLFPPTFLPFNLPLYPFLSPVLPSFPIPLPLLFYPFHSSTSSHVPLTPLLLLSSEVLSFLLLYPSPFNIFPSPIRLPPPSFSFFPYLLPPPSSSSSPALFLSPLPTSLPSSLSPTPSPPFSCPPPHSPLSPTPLPPLLLCPPSPLTLFPYPTAPTPPPPLPPPPHSPFPLPHFPPFSCPPPTHPFPYPTSPLLPPLPHSFPPLPPHPLTPFPLPPPLPLTPSSLSPTLFPPSLPTPHSPLSSALLLPPLPHAPHSPLPPHPLTPFPCFARSFQLSCFARRPKCNDSLPGWCAFPYYARPALLVGGPSPCLPMPPSPSVISNHVRSRRGPPLCFYRLCWRDLRQFGGFRHLARLRVGLWDEGASSFKRHHRSPPSHGKLRERPLPAVPLRAAPSYAEESLARCSFVRPRVASDHPATRPLDKRFASQQTFVTDGRLGV